MALAFPRVEYQERLARLRTQMDKKGLSLLVVVNPANMNYISGFDAWSYQNPQALLVPHSDPEPVWVGRGIDVPAAHNTTWLSDDNIVGYPDSYADNFPQHAMEAVAEEIQKRGWNTGRIGYEGDTFFFSPRGFFALQKNISAEWIDAGILVNWLRAIKTPREIAFMRRAGTIVDKVMGVAIDNLEEGIRENDLAARIVQAQIEGDREFGASFPCAIPFIQTGEHAGVSHAPWTTDVIPKGSLTVLELSGVYFRYNAALCRTVTLGKPSDRLVRLADIVREGCEAAMAAMKPGVTCHDVWAAWQGVLAPSGFCKHSRIGYSMGLNYSPTWREHTLSLEPGRKDELREGMCFHVLCGMWTGDGTKKGEPNYGLSETVLVTKNGCETLTNVKRTLFVKE